MAAVVIPADEAPSPDPGSPSGSSDTTTSGFDDKDSDKDAKKKKNRCATCRKKVGLTGKHSDQFFASLDGSDLIKMASKRSEFSYTCSPYLLMV